MPLAGLEPAPSVFAKTEGAGSSPARGMINIFQKKNNQKCRQILHWLNESIPDCFWSLGLMPDDFWLGA